MKKCLDCQKIPQITKTSNDTWKFSCCEFGTKVFTGFKNKQDAITNWNWNNSQSHNSDITILIRITEDDNIECSTNCTKDEEFEKIKNKFELAAIRERYCENLFNLAIP